MNVSGVLSETVGEIYAMPTWVVVLSKVTLLLATAWLVHFALVKADPRWRVLLWRGVAVGLALVIVWAIGLPGFAVRFERPASVAVARSSSVQAVRPVAATADPVVILSDISDTLDPSVAAETAVVVEPSSVDVYPYPAGSVESHVRTVAWQAVLLGVWGTGMVVLVVRLAVAYLRLAKMLRTSKRAPEAVVAEVRRIAAALQCPRTVRVRSSERFAVPFLYGLRRPVLVLPDRMCEAAYRSQLPGVLAHELAHMRSRDLAWNAILQAVLIGFWFHPLAWRIGSVHRAACDRVSDAVSVAYLGDVRAYCRTLARVALEIGSATPVGLAMARRSDVRRRLAFLEWKVFAAPLRRRVVAGVAVVGLAGLGLLAGVRLVEAEVSSPGEAQAATVSAAKDEQPAKTDSAVSSEPGFRPMQIRVVDPEGKPIVDAGVTVRAMTDVPQPTKRYRTGTEGVAEIEVPAADCSSLQLLIWQEGRVTTGAHWKQKTVRRAIPAELTVTLEPGTALGGIVRNEQGEPLAGAEVTVNGHKSPPGQVLWWSINDTVTSDADGRWVSHRVPKDLKGFDVKVKVRHPDCVSPSAFDVAEMSIDELRSQTAALVVHKGIAVEGSVTDPDGKPVAGALVGQVVEHFMSGYVRATTDPDGRYRLPQTEPGEYTLAVAAEGYGPNSRRVKVTAEERTFDLQLHKGEPICLRIVDQDGNPMARAAVRTMFGKLSGFVENTRGALPGNDRNLTTDAEGRWSRLWIPKEELSFYITKKGYESVMRSFSPNELEQVVTLKSGGWAVSGRVVQRDTKAPVTEFIVVEGRSHGSGDSQVIWRDGRSVADEDGRYWAAWDRSGDSRRVLRIEAKGYLPSEILRLKSDERSVIFDVELLRGEAVTGVVLSSDGEPLADAQVALCTATRGVYLRNGTPQGGRPGYVVQTGADGRFSFTPQKERFVLLVLHEDGFARVEQEEAVKEIRLGPWARVEGTALIGNKPAAEKRVSLNLGGFPPSGTTRIRYDYQATTDDRGHFAFEKVVPGDGRVIRLVVADQGQLKSMIPAHTVKATFVAGETTRVELARDGRRVAGKLLMPLVVQGEPAWHLATIFLMLAPPLPPEIPWPEEMDPNEDREAAREWWETWKESEEGRRLLEMMNLYNETARAIEPVHYGTKVEPDGSFVFEDVPAGDYRLMARLPAPPPKGHVAPGKVIANLEHSFSVPKMPTGRSDEALDLGGLTLSVTGN